MQTYYEVLGVSVDASSSTIRTSYLRLLHIYHPDHNQDSETHHEAAEIIKAYRILSDAEKRAEYDRTLQRSVVRTILPSLMVCNDSHGLFSMPRTFTVMPGFAIALAILIAIIGYAHQPTGREAIYRHATRSTSELTDDALNGVLYPSPTETVPARIISPRKKVDELVNELAGSIKSEATPAGTHLDGMLLINDYKLDRSKYRPEEFDYLATEMSPLIGEQTADVDGFASRAYFNAKLMALSITILKDFDEGRDIAHDVKQIAGLGREERLQDWLTNSKYVAKFHSLEDQLQWMELHQQIGISRADNEMKIENLAKEIYTARLKIRKARTRKDQMGERLWTAMQKQDISLYYTLLLREKRRYLAHNKIDMAFNRCLDPTVLASSNEQIDFVTPVVVDPRFDN